MKPSFSASWLSAAFGLALSAAAAGAAAVPPPPAPASQESAQARARLDALRARIAELTNQRAAELAQRDVLGARLRQAELAVTAKRRSLEVLHAAATAVERRRSLSRAEQTQARAELDSAGAALAGQILAAYMIGRQEQFKLLLSQTDPRVLGRLITYYGYFGRERAAQINAIGARERQLQAIAIEIEQESARLKVLSGDGNRELAELESARTERLAALAALASRVETRDQQLAALKRDSQAAESLLAELASVLQQFPAESFRNFEQLKGKLPWPVAGRLLQHPNDPPNGIVIEATDGAKVRAPYAGRVMYADWLPGLGLLLVVAHSDGYLSLYGHAEVLYKSVGDRVAAGEVIAGLSKAAGSSARLYFALRQGRKALDTKAWLRVGP